MAAKRTRATRSPYVTVSATDRQNEFLAAVDALTAELGRAPSSGEIGDRLGITRLGARKQLQKLERQGRLAAAPITTMTGWARP